MPTEIKKPQQNLVKDTEEPKSAHATPVVEKYIEKRNDKAQKQIDKEHDAES